MRLLHAADLHGGLVRYAQPAIAPWGNSRVMEFERVLTKMVGYADEHEVDVVLIAGDLWDNRNPSMTMLRIFATFADRITAAGRKLLYVSGNHDGASTLGDETSHALYWLKVLNKAGVTVYTRPTIDIIKVAHGEFVMVAFPYPHRRAITGLDESRSAMSPEELVIEGGRKMTELIAAYRDEAFNGHGSEGRPVIFMGHMTALGARTASERLMKMEWDIAVDLDVLAPFDYAAMGHIHKQQALGKNVWYPGSPINIDFSEAGTAKGFLLVDVQPGHDPVVTPLPSDPIPMARVKLPYAGVPEWDNVPPDGLRALRGAIVKLTIDATGSKSRPPDQWVAATEGVFRDAGVHFLKTEVLWTDPTLPAELRKKEATLDLTNKEVALRHYLHLNGLPEEPYLTASRTLMER